MIKQKNWKTKKLKNKNNKNQKAENQKLLQHVYMDAAVFWLESIRSFLGKQNEKSLNLLKKR